MAQGRFLAALRILAKHKVEFILVGGVAATLRGAVYATNDLEIVHSHAVENMPAILAALKELDARYRYGSEFRPNESHLTTQGHQLCRPISAGLIFSARSARAGTTRTFCHIRRRWISIPASRSEYSTLKPSSPPKRSLAMRKIYLSCPSCVARSKRRGVLKAPKHRRPARPTLKGSGRLTAGKHHHPVRLTVLSPRC
jgi:hypothetical protein